MLLGLELFPEEQRDTEITSANSVFRIIFKCISIHMLIHVTFHIITDIIDWTVHFWTTVSMLVCSDYNSELQPKQKNLSTII